MSGKTVIRVRCDDQALKITEAPTLASGGLNEAVVAFAFCDKWNGFAKTGVFYRNDDEPYYSVLDENDTCVVPWEVYAEPGYFSFSVFGDKDDIRRTSVSLKYKVVKGINASAMMPSDPSPDVYDQIMAEVAATNAKANELWEAAENGEFDGERGEKGEKGDQGEKGDPGKTPVPGIDFYTPEEQTAIKDDMLSQIGIKQTASGTAITLPDSADCKLQTFFLNGGTEGEAVNIEISGKNYFDISKVEQSYVSADGWIRHTRTGVHGDLYSPHSVAPSSVKPVPEYLIPNLPVLPAGTYTLSYEAECVDNSEDPSNLRVCRVNTDKDSEQYEFGGIIGGVTVVSGASFSLETETAITLRRVDNSTTHRFRNIQIERGEVATDHEPYHAPQAVTVEATGGTVDVLAQNPNLRSYCHTTYINTDKGNIPMETTYITDTKAYIDNKFAQLAKALATN